MLSAGSRRLLRGELQKLPTREKREGGRAGGRSRQTDTERPRERQRERRARAQVEGHGERDGEHSVTV